MFNKKIGIIFIISLLVTGCANSKQSPEEFNYLANLTKDDVRPEFGDSANSIRMGALRDTALSIGARGGLAWRSKQINDELDEQAPYLDNILSFNSLMIGENMVPPILVEAQNNLNLDSSNSLTISDVAYRIVRPARLSTTPPNWREYLIMNVSEPENPDGTLLPNTPEERELWVQYLHEGWNEGVKQAQWIYEDNLARAKRDYEGMIRYHILLAQNKVTQPTMTSNELGITGGGDSLSIGVQTYNIESAASLNPESGAWTVQAITEP